MNPEYTVVNPEDMLLFVKVIVAIGSFVVGVIVGWLIGNWKFDKIVRDIEEHLEDVGRKILRPDLDKD